MECFSTNGFGLAKVGLERKSQCEALSGFCSQPHAAGTWAPRDPQHLARSGKTPQTLLFSWLLLKPRYHFKALSLFTSYEILSSHLNFCISSPHDQHTVHSTKLITGWESWGSLTILQFCDYRGGSCTTATHCSPLGSYSLLLPLHLQQRQLQWSDKDSKSVTDMGVGAISIAHNSIYFTYF